MSGATSQTQTADGKTVGGKTVNGQTVGEMLVTGLKARNVDCVFGIPGVHTVELYRGLARSGIRHVTPRHEQGAAFMADGYARASGKPGVALVITGPGLTNTLTPIAQARADSVPMLVLSGVNARATLGKGWGCLHELPDQHGLLSTVACVSEHVGEADQLAGALDRAFAQFKNTRPGPSHIEVPLDLAGEAALPLPAPQPAPKAPVAGDDQIATALDLLNASAKVVILAGGGIAQHSDRLRNLAEALDAPVVQTVNARGVLFNHPLSVPASPSLPAVRRLIGDADCVLALGTEMGPTDYDMYETGTWPEMAQLIRVDICPKQLSRRPAHLSICADAGAVAQTLSAKLGAKRDGAQDGKRNGGADRAATARAAALDDIGADYRQQVTILNAMRDALPGARIIGDSTQPVYAGNLYYDHDLPGRWFNSATGYGALGYAIPAAIGAAIADPAAPVICLTGDGGAQFTLPEMMVAVEEDLPVMFVIWNNAGYREIASAMEGADVEVVGCTPRPPKFKATAKSLGMRHCKVADRPNAIGRALKDMAKGPGPAMIEVTAPPFEPKA